MFQIVNYLGPCALLANDRVFGLLSTGRPPYQWQIEFQGWFETSLSRVQATTVDWAVNTVDIGPYGHVAAPNPQDGDISKAAYHLCSSQRIRNTGSYQSFSTLGLVVVICVGITIIILSLTVELCVVCTRERKRWRDRETHNYREIARFADRKLQLLRMALTFAEPQGRWSRKMDDMTTTEGLFRFPLPTRVEDGDDSHYSHIEVQVPMEEVNGAAEESGHGGGTPPARPELLSAAEGSQAPLMAGQPVTDHGDPQDTSQSSNGAGR